MHYQGLRVNYRNVLEYRPHGLELSHFSRIEHEDFRQLSLVLVKPAARETEAEHGGLHIEQASYREFAKLSLTMPKVLVKLAVLH
jgi:hypothetical protein